MCANYFFKKIEILKHYFRLMYTGTQIGYFFLIERGVHGHNVVDYFLGQFDVIVDWCAASHASNAHKFHVAIASRVLTITIILNICEINKIAAYYTIPSFWSSFSFRLLVNSTLMSFLCLWRDIFVSNWNFFFNG